MNAISNETRQLLARLDSNEGYVLISKNYLMHLACTFLRYVR